MSQLDMIITEGQVDFKGFLEETYELSKALSKKKVNRISMTEILKAGSE